MSSEEDNTQTDRFALVQHRFDVQGLGSLETWIAQHRALDRSWRDISYELKKLIGMDVSYETLRRWFDGETYPAGQTRIV